MKTKTNRLKKLAIALVTVPVFAIALLGSAPTKTSARSDDQDAATLYTANKCSICHGPKAAKFFDATKGDDVLVATVMSGKKADKPPNMPAYSEKGLTPDQAKVIVTYMKSLNK